MTHAALGGLKLDSQQTYHHHLPRRSSGVVQLIMRRLGHTHKPKVQAQCPKGKNLKGFDRAFGDRIDKSNNPIHGNLKNKFNLTDPTNLAKKILIK